MTAHTSKLRSILYVLFGHPRVASRSGIQAMCARCSQVLGVTVAGRFSLSEYVNVGHDCDDCDLCLANEKALRWHERLLTPRVSSATNPAPIPLRRKQCVRVLDSHSSKFLSRW